MSQADQARFSAEPPRRGWFGRNWLWLVPTIIVVPVLLCGGCFAGIFFTVVGMIKDSGAYKMALERVQLSPEVQAKLGQPIVDDTMLPKGNVQMDNAEGTAKILFNVKGPNGTAVVDIDALIVDGAWHFEKLDVNCSDGTTVDLSDEPVVLEGDAPAFGEESVDETDDTEEDRPKGPAAPDLNINIEE